MIANIWETLKRYFNLPYRSQWIN